MTQATVRIDIARQRLYREERGRVLAEYAVSTGKAGVGEEEGSGRTPRGGHRVRAKIGAGAPLGAVFVGRRPTGEVYDDALGERWPERDWVLTRILWLSGTERGRNRLGRVDTMRRYIYIHGCPDRFPMGVPLSHGCIRMRNTDIAELFERVEPGTPVLSEE